MTPLRLLIVEDSPDDAELLVLELRRAGYTLSWQRVETPEEMRAAVESTSFDVILSDYTLPEFSARAALGLAKEIAPELPFVVVSGTIGEELAVEMMRAGASDYILKHSLARLGPALARELREAENRRERRRAEQSVRELAAIVQSSDDAIVGKTLDGVITSWNPGAERLYGYAAAGILGKHIGLLVPPDRREELAEIMARLQRGERVTPFETVRVRKNGLAVPVSLSISPIQDTLGRVVGASAIARDITEKRRAEDAVRASESRFRSIIEKSFDAVILSEAGGRLVYASQTSVPILGRSTEELIGCDGFTLLHPDDLPSIRPLWENLLRTPGGMMTSTHRARRGGAEWRWVETRCTNLLDDSSVRAVVINFRDVTDQREAEERLLQSQREAAQHLALLETLLGNAPVGFAFIDTEHRYVRANNALAAFTGVPAAEMIGRTVQEIVPHVWSQVQPIYQRLLAGDGPSINREISAETRAATGRLMHCLVSHFPVCLGGETIGIGIVVNDITERKKTEEVLARYAAIVEDTSDSIISTTLDGVITSWNPGASRLYGYAAEEMIGKPLSILVPPDRVQEFEQIMGRIRQGTGAASFETERVRKDGSIAHVSVTVSPFQDRERRSIGASFVARDISDRKRTEEALRLRDRAMQAVDSGILITDPNQPDNPTIYASPGFERLTGYRREEILGRNCRFLQGKDTDRAAIAEIRAAIHEARSCDVEVLNYRKDGSPFWNALLISPVRDDTGRLTHFVGVQTDVTERRSLEEQFRQAQKMEAVGRLAGGVAHDFNNLLTIINGYGTIVMTGLAADNPARKLLQEITNAGERAAGLTRQLLAFSRKTVLEPKVLDLNAQVREIAKLVGRLIGEDIQLATSLDPELGRVKVDAGQLEQAVINLCVNARDAMPQGGRITIETHNVELDEMYAKQHADVQPGSYVMLAVADTGHGMGEATKARIFEPFFTTKGQGKGTGLGLAMVFGFVKQSGGHVTVYSERGRGATFKLYLPHVQEAVSSSKSHHGLGVLPKGTETILLVEDEVGVRSLARHLLQTCGYNVLDAGFGKEAVRIADEHSGPIHLLISDVVMPHGMGGRQVAEAICARRHETKILFVSGYTDDAVVRHGILEEKMNFLQKPFTPGSLAQKVREVLDAMAPVN